MTLDWLEGSVRNSKMFANTGPQHSVRTSNVGCSRRTVWASVLIDDRGPHESRKRILEIEEGTNFESASEHKAGTEKRVQFS